MSAPWKEPTVSPSLPNADQQFKLLKYSAASLSNRMYAISADLRAAKPLKGGINIDVDRRLADAVSDHLRTLPVWHVAAVKEFVNIVAKTADRVTTSAVKPKEQADAVDKLAGALLGLSKSSSDLKGQFSSKAEDALNKLDFKAAPARAVIASIVMLAGLGVAGLLAIAHAAFLPIPAYITFGSVFSMHGLTALRTVAAAVPWALIDVLLAFVGLMGREAYPKGYAPLAGKITPFSVVQLGLMAALEELIFRVGGFIGVTMLLTTMGMPGIAAMILGAAVSQAVFAAAHGYGPKLPRFLGGILFAYLLLTHGFLFAAAVHAISNWFLISSDWISGLLKRPRSA